MNNGVNGALDGLDSLDPSLVIRPETAEELAAELTRARSAGRRVLPLGQGTRPQPSWPPGHADAAMGRPSRAGGRADTGPSRVDNGGPCRLSTTHLARIIQYEPADLTVTVGAGCDLGVLGNVLAEHRQFLPLQHLRGRGTVGGLVATAAEGAVSLGYGAVRDRLIGLKTALADGSIVQGGGRVVKNVARYAIHRLLPGSRGTLGVIVEASFKVHPRPETEATAVFEFASERSAFEAARLVLDSGLEPSFASVLIDSSGSRLAVGFDGVEPRVQTHLKVVRDLVAPVRPRGCAVLSERENLALRRLLDDPVGEPAVRHEPTPARPHLPAASAGAARDGQEPENRREPRNGREPRNLDAHVLAPAPRLNSIVVRLTALPAKIEMMAVRAQAAARESGAEARIDARPGLGSAYLMIDVPDLTPPRPGPERSARATREMSAATSIEAGHQSPEVRDPTLEASDKATETGDSFREAALVAPDHAVGSGDNVLDAALQAPHHAAECDHVLQAAFMAALSVARSFGHAVVVSAPPKIEDEFDAWGPAPPDYFLMERIKRALDREGLFAAGRFVGGL